MNSETGKDKLISEMEAVILLAIEHHNLMFDALDKINSLTLDEIDEGPRIACEVLDIVNPTNGGG